MAHSIKILNLVATPNSSESRPEYTAQGECNGRSFDAKTIIYQGAPIFKVQEEGGLKKLVDSSFTRGERIAIARACKLQLEAGALVEDEAPAQDPNQLSLTGWLESLDEEGEVVESDPFVIED
jgi:hypothetical protein